MHDARKLVRTSTIIKKKIVKTCMITFALINLWSIVFTMVCVLLIQLVLIMASIYSIPPSRFVDKILLLLLIYFVQI